MRRFFEFLEASPPGLHARRTATTSLLLCACCLCVAVPLAAQQCPDGSPPPCAGAAAPARPAPHSVAVLTFENTTRDTSAQYLAEGLADQIFTRLGGVARLTMISRTAVRRLRSPEQLSVQQLGRALNASYLVSGSIRAAGGRVRVNVEALRAATGEAVWSEAYDRAREDLIGLEEAIATEVAAGVAGRLGPRERRVLQSRVTASSRAYEQFLRGNVLLARRSTGALRDAIAAYQAATAADPAFADAYGRLAYTYAVCATWECQGDELALLRLSRDASTSALRLNPGSSDGWMGRANLLAQWFAFVRRDSDDSLLACLAAFRRAIALNPRNDEAWHQYGMMLAYVSDSASLNALRRALALDPARAVTYLNLSLTYSVMGRNDRALATIDSAISLDPDGPFRSWRALYRLTAGDTVGALADARLTPALGSTPAVAILAGIGHDSAAVRAMEGYVAQWGCNRFSTWYLLWAGQREQAVQLMLECGPSLWGRFWGRFPVRAPVAGDPRVQAVWAESERILARARWR